MKEKPPHTREEDVSFSTALRMALRSIREAIIPGYILLALAACIVIGYYNIPSFYELMEIIGQLKRDWGFLFSIISSGFFGGVMPWVFRMIVPSTRPRRIWSYLLFCWLLWSFQGLTVDTLYRTQALLFGTATTFSVILCKVLFDQFGYSFLFSSVLNSNAYYWADSGFSFKSWRATLKKGWYKAIVLPNYLANLAIWLPGTVIIYSLPPDLQIFMAGLISCFYSLIATYIASKSRKSVEKRAP